MNVLPNRTETEKITLEGDPETPDKRTTAAAASDDKKGSPKKRSAEEDNRLEIRRRCRGPSQYDL